MRAERPRIDPESRACAVQTCVCVCLRLKNSPTTDALQTAPPPDPPKSRRAAGGPDHRGGYLHCVRSGPAGGPDTLQINKRMNKPPSRGREGGLHAPGKTSRRRRRRRKRRTRRTIDRFIKKNRQVQLEPQTVRRRSGATCSYKISLKRAEPHVGQRQRSKVKEGKG